MGICKKRINTPTGSCVHFVYPEGQHHPGFCTIENAYVCIDNLSALIPRLSHSTVQDWLTCRKCFYLKHIRGIEKIPSTMSNALKMGSLWDICQQKVCGSATDKDILDVISKYEIEEHERLVVKNMLKAFRKLGLHENISEGRVQERFELVTTIDRSYPWIDNDDFKFIISGVYDRAYDNYFAENKFTSVPDFYQDVFFMTSQLGTYFLSNDKFEYCVVEIARTPMLKKSDNEDSETFGERVFLDVLKRPGFYFIGYNPKARTYGRKFFRNEFNLEALENRYKNIGYEIMDANERDAFYNNEKMCMKPWQCDMLDICKTGNMSESLYRFKDRPSTDRSERLEDAGDTLNNR